MILFVDDEPHLRTLGQAILERIGYRVLLAEDGLQAVELFRQNRGKVQLVILDLTMPRLSGTDTLRELRAIDRGVRVLLTSGFAPEQVTDVAEQVTGFVPKPYMPRQLAASVRQALECEPAAN